MMLFGIEVQGISHAIYVYIRHLVVPRLMAIKSIHVNSTCSQQLFIAILFSDVGESPFLLQPCARRVHHTILIIYVAESRTPPVTRASPLNNFFPHLPSHTWLLSLSEPKSHRAPFFDWFRTILGQVRPALKKLPIMRRSDLFQSCSIKISLKKIRKRRIG
jgi:hypothetical protein